MRSNSSPNDPLQVECSAPGVPVPGARLRAYIRLAFGLGLLALFMAGATLFSARVPALVTMAERIETYDLRPSAIYYTDHNAAAEGEAFIHDSLTYPPRKP